MSLTPRQLKGMPILITGWRNGFDLPRTLGQLALAGVHLSPEQVRRIWNGWEMGLIKAQQALHEKRETDMDIINLYHQLTD